MFSSSIQTLPRNSELNGIVPFYSSSLGKKLVNLIDLASSSPSWQDFSIQRIKPHEGPQNRPSMLGKSCSLASRSANVERFSRYLTHTLALLRHSDLTDWVVPVSVVISSSSQTSLRPVVMLILCRISG